MPAYIALLRAVNLGGTNRILMPDLKRICEAAGCSEVTTYIASGNVVFYSSLPEAKLKSKLEKSLTAFTGKPMHILIRTAAEMESVHAANPFPEAPPNLTVAIFLDTPPPLNTLSTVARQTDERIGLGTREIYVHYGSGMGRSKLTIPAAKIGTARNLNTVRKLAQMAAKVEAAHVKVQG